MKKRKINWVSTAALLLLLLVLPLGSWFYLKKGFDYQLQARSELKDYGRLPSFSFRTETGDTFSDRDVDDRTLVAGFLTTEQLRNHEDLRNHIFQLNSQFFDREEMLLLTFLRDGEDLSPTQLAQLENELQLKNTEQWYLLSGSASEIQRVERAFAFPEGSNPQFALVDSLTIRNYYDATDPARAGRLAEHLAIILPAE